MGNIPRCAKAAMSGESGSNHRGSGSGTIVAVIVIVVAQRVKEWCLGSEERALAPKGKTLVNAKRLARAIKSSARWLWNKKMALDGQVDLASDGGTTYTWPGSNWRPSAC